MKVCNRCRECGAHKEYVMGELVCVACDQKEMSIAESILQLFFWAMFFVGVLGILVFLQEVL